MKNKNVIVSFLFFVALSFFFCTSTKKPAIDPNELCIEFYKLNNSLYLDELLNVSMVGVRDKVEFNNMTHKYECSPAVIYIFDSIQNKNIMLWSYMRYGHKASTDLQRSMFSRCDSSCIAYLKKKYKTTSDTNVFLSYIQEIETIFFYYNQIKVPDILPYSNIGIVGYNNYIEFILYKMKINL